jgi:hypothetical protein
MPLIRKILVGLASLTVIVGMYMLYSRSSKTPHINIGSSVDIDDINAPKLGAGGGKIGSVEVPLLENPVYRRRNPGGQIDREFGFAELVRAIGDVWDVDKPWMTIYQQDYRFEIKADHGTTELETIVGSSTPKDAAFKGNVTIKIVPLADTTHTQSTIHLDSLIFLSEKSRFSTPGYVKLVSQDVNMDGRGLEFVYNDRTQRLDYVRLMYLDELRIKGAAEALFSKLGSPPPVQDASESPQNVPKGDPPVLTSKEPAQAPKETEPAQTSSPADPDPAAAAQGEFYKCILSENVLIETPDEIVFARNEISINDILWSKPLAGEDANSIADSNSPGTSKADQPKVVAESPKEKPSVEPNAPAEKMAEITVRCGNGMLLVPLNSRKTLASFEHAEANKAEFDKTLAELFADANERSTFTTERIDYNSVSGDAVSRGHCELVFQTGGISTLGPNETSVPVTVSSTEAVHLFKEANQAVFTGDCLLKMPQAELTQPRDVTFSASNFTVNLPQDTPDRAKVPGDIIAAGPVELIFHVEDSNAADGNKPPVPVSITALEQARFVPDSNQVIFNGNCLCTMQQPNLPPEQKFTLTSPRLIANLPKKGAKNAPDVVAMGPVKLEGYVDAFDSNEPNAAPLPVTVTATKHARFIPADNQVIFEGDSKAVVVREDPNFIEQYILSSQKIIVDLPEDGNPSQSSLSAMGIEHFTASGGVVTLATKKTAGELLLSGIEVICRKFDYDPNAERFTANGPGVIKLANAEQPDPNKTTGKFSLKKPCWAFIENYDNLTWFQKEKRIVADAQSDEALVVKYLPIKDGQIGDLSILQTNHVEAILIETPLGGTELATLTASGGITYQAKDNEFIGGQLFYDHEKQLIKIIGSDSFPCRFNGALAEEIEYDLKTDKIKADLAGPGALRQRPRR